MAGYPKILWEFLKRGPGWSHDRRFIIEILTVAIYIRYLGYFWSFRNLLSDLRQILILDEGVRVDLAQVNDVQDLSLLAQLQTSA